TRRAKAYSWPPPGLSSACHRVTLPPARCRPRSVARRSNQSTGEPQVRLTMALVIAPHAIRGHEGCEVRDFGERRKTLQQRARAYAFRQHGLDRGVRSLGEAAEDLARVRRGQRFGKFRRTLGSAKDATMSIALTRPSLRASHSPRRPAAPTLLPPVRGDMSRCRK